MNIYAKRGTKVIVTEESIDSGWPYMQEWLRKRVKVGDVLTVQYTIVHDSSTEVFFEEHPNESFNSVNFEDLEKTV